MDHSLKPMLPLETLRGFEAAARTGSFSAAAEQRRIFDKFERLAAAAMAVAGWASTSRLAWRGRWQAR